MGYRDLLMYGCVLNSYVSSNEKAYICIYIISFVEWSVGFQLIISVNIGAMRADQMLFISFSHVYSSVLINDELYFSFFYTYLIIVTLFFFYFFS